MTYTAIKTHEMLEANGIPINGISIGKLNDKSTWRIDFKPEATKAHIVHAQSLLQSFDPDSVPDPVSEVESLRAEIAVLTAQLNNQPLEKSAPKKKK